MASKKMAVGIIAIIVIAGYFSALYFLGGGTSIIIRSNSDFEKFNFPGNGTIDDPYIIAGRWIFTNPTFGGGFCISIRNTNAYVTIRDCGISSTRDSGVPVDFTDASNIVIESCIIRNARIGIWVFRCDNIEILNNQISNCGTGINLAQTDTYLITGNSYSDCDTDENLDS